MKIKDIGGEFSLIDRLAKIVGPLHGELIAGIGDDAAVIRVAPEPAPYLLVTTDLLVEDRHFTGRWFSPEQIGHKAVICNASDIAAMGGRPTWMFVSLVLTTQTEVAWIEDLYRGMSQACQSLDITIAGGDTTRGPVVSMSITLLGKVHQNHLCLRRHAQPGDLIMVTGSLGASAAALALLEKGLEPSAYLLAKHRTPDCRMDISHHIAPLARAMIDISDGLGSEVRHICSQSFVGAEIFAEQIPLHPEVRHAGALLGIDPIDFALQGGEDFELLFTIAREQAEQLKKSTTDCRQIGIVTGEKSELALLRRHGHRTALPTGFNHFSEPA